MATEAEATGHAGAKGDTERPNRPFWKEGLDPYARPDVRRSVVDLLTSVVPYLLLFAAMYFALDVSVLLTLALGIPAAGFLLRTYIIFHDCAHGSFLPSKRANVWLGTSLGLLVYTCYAAWKREHAIHHASAGDLDRRGVGDVTTLTLAEYRAMGFWGRTGYRLFRNPFVMFGLGPIWALVVQPRVVPGGARPNIRRAVHLTNLALAIAVTGMCFLMGWKEFLLIQGTTAWIAGSAGVWLFYVQHQFEETYWESGEGWTYADAALKGSSYLKLPKVFQYFTGNIGLHHVHHLSARVPNYKLQAAHDNNPIFHDVPVLTGWDGIRSARLKLWDEDRGRLITWAEARAVPAPRTQATAEPATEIS